MVEDIEGNSKPSKTRNYFAWYSILLYSTFLNFIAAPLGVWLFYNYYTVPHSQDGQNRISVTDLFGIFGSNNFSVLIVSLFWTFFMFGFWMFVRWVAATAERAQRSYLGFMLIAIFFPPIAWIIVLTFKRNSN